MYFGTNPRVAQIAWHQFNTSDAHRHSQDNGLSAVMIQGMEEALFEAKENNREKYTQRSTGNDIRLPANFSPCFRL